MTYIVYAGMTIIYEQEHQYRHLLSHFDFDKYCSYFVARQPFATYLKNLKSKWIIAHAVCGHNTSMHRLCDVLVEIRIYIEFESKTDAILFKLTYDPEIPEY